MSKLNKFVIEIDENKPMWDYGFFIKNINTGALLSLYEDSNGLTPLLQGVYECAVSSRVVFYARESVAILEIFDEIHTIHRKPNIIDKNDLISAINAASNNGKYIDARVLVEMLEVL